MEKVDISITLIAQDNIVEYNLSGEYDKEKEIIYYEENNQTKMEFQLKDKKMIRVIPTGTIILPFIEKEETIGKVIVDNKELDLPIQTKVYRYKNQSLELNQTALLKQQTKAPPQVEILPCHICPHKNYEHPKNQKNHTTTKMFFCLHLLDTLVH